MSEKSLDKKILIKILIIAFAVTCVRIALGVLFYDNFPDKVPTHFDFNGNINGYTSKNMFIYAMPLIMFLITVIMAIKIYNDPFDKHKDNKNSFLIKFSILIIPITDILIFLDIYVFILGNTHSPKLIGIFLSILFIIIGNYLPKNKQNSAIGIRNAWTLKDETNWNKTNRLGGFLFSIGGLIMLMLNIFVSRHIALGSIAIISILTGLIVTLYSFYLYKKQA